MRSWAYPPPVGVPTVPAHLAHLVQRLSQELLVNATEVGHLLLALMMYVHATVWGEGEGPSGSLPGQDQTGHQQAPEELPPPSPRLSQGQGGGEERGGGSRALVGSAEFPVFRKKIHLKYHEHFKCFII